MGRKHSSNLFILFASLFLIFIIAMATFMSACAEESTPTSTSAPAPAQTTTSTPKPITIKFISQETETQLTWVETKKACERIASRSGGRGVFEYYPLETLVPMKELFSAVQTGTGDMMSTFFGLFTGMENGYAEG